MKQGLYPAFLDAGHTPDEFWSLGMDEISDMLESHQRGRKMDRERRRDNLKDAVALLWNQNQQLVNLIGCALAKGEDPVLPQYYYPELFEEEIAESEQEQKKRQIELHKARMEEYAFRHNRALEERGDDHGGDNAKEA